MTSGDQKIFPYLWVTKTGWPTLALIPKSGKGAAQSRSEPGPGGGKATKVIWGCNLKGQSFVFMGKAMASHSSTLAWKIPWMEKPGRLQSMGSHRVGHD